MDFHVPTATDIFMKNVIDSSLHRAFSREIMEMPQALTLTIVWLNLVSKGLSFYCTAIFAGLSTT